MTEAGKHWEQVYLTKSADAVSWYQPHPDISLAYIAASGLPRGAPIIDVGGGASTLVDHLLDEGYTDLTVLDISASALKRSQDRMGPAMASRVHWVDADITQFQPSGTYVLWHDRAVFHFLTTREQRSAYLACLRRCLRRGGTVILATFALDGPSRCSGLEIVRYHPATLLATLGSDFELIATQRETHVTPWGSTQAFVYVHMRYRPTTA